MVAGTGNHVLVRQGAGRNTTIGEHAIDGRLCFYERGPKMRPTCCDSAPRSAYTPAGLAYPDPHRMAKLTCSNEGILLFALIGYSEMARSSSVSRVNT